MTFVMSHTAAVKSLKTPRDFTSSCFLLFTAWWWKLWIVWAVQTIHSLHHHAENSRKCERKQELVKSQGVFKLLPRLYNTHRYMFARFATSLYRYWNQRDTEKVHGKCMDKTEHRMRKIHHWTRTQQVWERQLDLPTQVVTEMFIAK